MLFFRESARDPLRWGPSTCMLNLMKTTTNVTPGSINLRGEIFSWTDFDSRRAVIIEMMWADVTVSRILGTEDSLYATDAGCKLHGIRLSAGGFR